MSVGTSLRRLGEFLEECERTDAASVRESSVTVTDSGASADVEFALSSDADGDIPVRIRGASLDSDGSIGLTLGVDDVLPSDREHVAVDAADVSLDGDPAVVVTVATDAPTTSSTETADDDADSEPPEAVRNPNVPAFEDTTYLEAVYARYETFERMADAFEMDVTDETVRRYMIDQGVHEPSSYETSLAGDPTGVERPPAPAADGDGSPEALADGIGLPESVTIDQLADAANDAKTVYEFGKALDLERMDALDLLQDLDLLEFVMGRLTTDDDPDVSREDVVARIRQSAGET
ncbi:MULTISPECIES: hypothetical protein [Haloferax]|uniref:Uncharacterized protein n=3 Tax=Haloferax volcanii TaxID=2246 RepID=A0A558GFC0_HALVO|nr:MULTISPECIES: hypothetical protein [Haloferax]ELZ77529.1 hypothetical protein C456_02156 [Haloferax lucentense DSM 14919]ELZ95653.1 hypothetical protein C452_00815 [Haloferax alexandrinus JCM 10717]NLV03186.1 hypothetical protein [Haloferax alexandrinus]RDZ34226.1 hypothetical protein C5B88_16530 [Haloferax sp. Atlit-24N]RDZ38313.1 hypothetical protein C5B89_13000 [Haloferax sp. Atlit-47N]